MPTFLKLLPPQQALGILFQNMPASRPSVEDIDTFSACERVTALDITSPESLPAFTRSAMDGFAVIAADTYGTSETLPAYLKLIGEVPMGSSPSFAINPGEAALIHTGGMLPEKANAVIMVEQTQTTGDGTVEILKSVAPGENLLLAGEDVKPGQIIILAGKTLTPEDIGGLLALGIMKVPVFVKPKIGILSSGDEVVPPDVKPLPGQVRDINSYALGLLAEKNGAVVTRYGILPDKIELLKQKTWQAFSENDMVLITAGSSTSQRDLTAEMIQELGTPGVLVHGVNVRPGKPTILAVCDGKPVIGLPGNPVSALVIARLFVLPVIDRLLGKAGKRPEPYVLADLSASIPSQAGREDWIPVRLREEQGKVLADPIFFKSNLIFNLASADGLVKIPADATGLANGDQVKVIIR